MGVKNIGTVGSRGVVFTFEDDISVYLICADEYWFLCDTHLGPLSMDYIKKYLAGRAGNKRMIVFNSHSDWDHVWGNCAFAGDIIVGHELCRKRLSEIGGYELSELKAFHQGSVELVLPNVTFSDKMAFAAEQIEFIHAPGHTADSALCFDRKDAVLFIGDLVEYPIPYLDFADLARYINTLTYLKEFPAKTMVSAHSGIVSRELIEANIAYIKAVQAGKTVDPAVYGQCPQVHNFNINNQLFLRYEQLIRDKLSSRFDYMAFRSSFGDLKEIDYTILYQNLQQYLAELPQL